MRRNFNIFLNFSLLLSLFIIKIKKYNNEMCISIKKKYIFLF